MEEDVIELNGKKLDLSKLTDEQLKKLKEKIEMKEEKYKMLIAQYEEKYPFLKDVDLED